jgi:hypothetical protein
MSANDRNIVWPVTLIVVGVLFLAYNLGFLHFAQLREIIGTWWPVVLIALGVAGLLQKNRR